MEKEIKRKRYFNMTEKQKQKLVDEFMEFHPSMTKPTEFNMVVKNGHIEVTPKDGGNTLYCIEKFISFVNYYGASCFVSVYDDVPTLVIC